LYGKFPDENETNPFEKKSKKALVLLHSSLLVAISSHRSASPRMVCLSFFFDSGSGS
jgi:hypothetical protein